MKRQMTTAMPFLVLALMFNGMATRTVDAQIKIGGAIDVDGEPDIEAMLKSQLEQTRKSWEQKLALRINEIERVCELSDEQVKKLKVAAKGAVTQTAAKQKKAMKQMMGGIVGIAPGIENDDDGGDFEEGGADAGDIEIDGIPEGVVQGMPVFQALDPMFGNGNPEKSKVWETTLKKTLSKDQSEKYDKVIARRRQFARRAAVNSFVAKIDHQLLLNDDQRTKMKAFIDEEYGELLAKTESSQFPMFELFGNFGGVQGGQGGDSPVKNFLDEKQYSVWKSRIAPAFSMLEQQFDFAEDFDQ